ncbi:unnamed protein product (mitochondrion) [Plasmodiophora brassicae]|uniref:Uncharacterized protein n=1 Tax=Plasmodiophora brassicae TaxID=37360 RepID=A0A3P3Y9K9_PLABS|nr:unnamed protein product [Plasmodiophora brassicae]
MTGVDLRVKQLNKSASKGQNRLKFQSIAERLSQINVDIHHRTARIDDRIDSDDIESTHFAAALASWSELNLTADFAAFHRDIRNLACANSLPLLLHNRTKAVDVILEHLLKPASLCLEALVDLISVLARDLRQEFFVELPRVLNALTDLIDPQNPNLLEAIFTSIAFLFKHLLRQIIDHAASLYVDVFSRCLSHPKQHVRDFAAQTFSYVLRKVRVRSRTAVFDAIVSTVTDDDNGVDVLFFHMFKGIGRAFHSCTGEALPVLLDSAARRSPHSDEFVRSLLKHMCEMTEAQHSSAVFEALLSGATRNGAQGRMSLQTWVGHRRASRVTNVGGLDTVLHDVPIDEPASLALIESSLLHCDLSMQTSARLLSKVFNGAPLEPLTTLAAHVTKRDALHGLVVQLAERRANVVDDLHDAVALLLAVVSDSDTNVRLSEKHLKSLKSCLQDIDEDESKALRAVSVVSHLHPSEEWNDALAECASLYICRRPSSPVLLKVIEALGDATQFADGLTQCIRDAPRNVVALQCYRFVSRDVLRGRADDALLGILIERLADPSPALRLASCRVLHASVDDDTEDNMFALMMGVIETEPSIETERDLSRTVGQIGKLALRSNLPPMYSKAVVPFLVGVLRVKFRLLWSPAKKALASIIHLKDMYNAFETALVRAADQASIVADGEPVPATAGRDSTDPYTFHSLLMNCLLEHTGDVINNRAARLVRMFLSFVETQYNEMYRVERTRARRAFVKDGENHMRRRLTDWLQVLGRISSPKKCITSQDDQARLRAVLERLQSNEMASVQKLALECTFRFKDHGLTPYWETLLALCDDSSFREQITLFSLARSASMIDPGHREDLLPTVFRVLVPKLTKHKTGSGPAVKASVHSRRNAVLVFVSTVDDVEFRAFIRIALGEIVLERPLAVPLSRQRKFVEVLTGMLEQVGARLQSSMPAIFTALATLITHHGKSLDEDAMDVDDEVDDEDGDARGEGGVVSRLLLRRAIHLGARLIDTFPVAFMAAEPSRRRILAVVSMWASRLAQELTQARSGVLDTIVAMSAHDELRPLLCDSPTLVRNAFALLSAPHVHADVVQAVLSCATNLADHGCLPEHLLTALVAELQTLLCSQLTSQKVCAEALALMTRLAPLIVSHGKSPDCTRLLQLLLPFARRATTAEQRVVVQAITSLVPFVPMADATSAFYAVHRLLLMADDVSVRQHICEFARAIQAPECHLLLELNAMATVKLETGPDYELRSTAYATVTAWQGHRGSSPLLCHILYDLRCSDMTLRGFAEHALVQWCKVASGHLDAAVSTALESLVFPQLRRNLSKVHSEKIRKATMEVLAALIAAFPTVYPDMQALVCPDDREVDILCNLVHIQVHRVRRALARIRTACSEGSISARCASMVLKPILMAFLYNSSAATDSAQADEIVRAFGAVSARQAWPQYKQTLMSLVRAVKKHPQQAKILIRATCAVLDEWAFDFDVADDGEATPVAPGEDDHEDEDDDAAAVVGDDVRQSVGKYLMSFVLPHLYSNLQSDGDIRVPVVMAIVKLLKRLPERVLEAHVPRLTSVLMKKLTGKEQRTRDVARQTLADVAVSLGPRYLRFILSEMGHFLDDGFKVQVLGYAVHSILERAVPSFEPGAIDHCLPVLIPVIIADLFGAAAEARAAQGVARKTREARHPKSMSSIELIASNVTVGAHIDDLLQPFQAQLEQTPTGAQRDVVRNALGNIAKGVRRNPGVQLRDLFVFSFRTISQVLDSADRRSELNDADGAPATSNGKVSKLDVVLVPDAPLRDMKPRLCRRPKSDGEILVGFALLLFERGLADSQGNSGAGDVRSLCDPFVELLWRCLNAFPSGDVAHVALKAFSALLQIPNGLPALEQAAPRFAGFMIDGARKGSPVFASTCFRGLTALLRRCEAYEIQEHHLLVLLEFVRHRLEDAESASGALALLKAILSRRLLAASLYDVMERCAVIIVEKDDAVMVRHAQQAVLQYLLDYPLSAKRVEQHLRGWVTNASEYARPQGRLASMKMLSMCVGKFPQSVVDAHANLLFVPLAVRLVNEDSKPCRVQVANLLQQLLSAVSQSVRSALLEYVGVWWSNATLSMQCIAAQIASLCKPASVALPQAVLDDWLHLALGSLNAGRLVLDRILERCKDDHTSVVAETWPTLYHTLQFVAQYATLPAASSCCQTALSLALFPHARIRSQINSLFSATGHTADLQQAAQWADAFLAQICATTTDASLCKSASENLAAIVVELHARDNGQDIVARVFHRISTRCRRAVDLASRSVALDWLVQVTSAAPASLLAAHADVIVAPAVAIVDDPSSVIAETLKPRAELLLDDLQQKLGRERFMEVHGRIREFAHAKRDRRKATRALEAVSNPELAARRRSAKSAGKQRQRQRKMGERKDRRAGLPASGLQADIVALRKRNRDPRPTADAPTKKPRSSAVI